MLELADREWGVTPEEGHSSAGKGGKDSGTGNDGNSLLYIGKLSEHGGKGKSSGSVGGGRK